MTKTCDDDAIQPPPARILVVDDEEVIHTSLDRLLGRRGHQVESVFSAEEGLTRLAAGGYDLVITDLMMPEMNGVELLDAMRERGLAVPVIMITGYPTIRTAMQALRLGAVDYVAKPFRRKELLGPVCRVLRRAAAGGDAATVPAARDDDVAERASQLPPLGAVFFLRDHSWAAFRQDGQVQIGVEASFLDSAGRIAAASMPEAGDLIEQGYVGATLTTVSGEEHGVVMPLSGQVVALNEAALADPSAITPDTWLLRVVPTNFPEEREYLQRR